MRISQSPNLTYAVLHVDRNKIVIPNKQNAGKDHAVTESASLHRNSMGITAVIIKNMHIEIPTSCFLFIQILSYNEIHVIKYCFLCFRNVSQIN